MSAASSSQQQRNFDFTYGNEHAKAIVRSHNARLTECAFEYIAQRTSLERAALRGLRNTFPGISSDALVQKWIDRLTGTSTTDEQDPTGDVIEAKAVDTMKRAEVFMDLLKHAEDNNPAENCQISRSAGHGFRRIGCWISPRKEQLIGAIINTDAASSASTGTTATTTGSPRILHCHLLSPTERAPL